MITVFTSGPCCAARSIGRLARESPPSLGYKVQIDQPATATHNLAVELEREMWSELVCALLVVHVFSLAALQEPETNLCKE